MKVLAIPLLLLTMVACGEPFIEAQEADTIEAYEKYLAENPSGRFALEADSRLQELLLQKAKADRAAEQYGAFLERFPDSPLKERAINERESLMFNDAAEKNTQESWQAYLDAYPKGDADKRKKAKRMLNVHEHLDHLAVGSVQMAQVNLAEDPEGPLDGWEFRVPVTNNGEHTYEEMHLTIDYLDENGSKVGGKEWGLVKPFWRLPIEEEHKKPLVPGQELDWVWTTGNMPEGWARQTRVYVSQVKVQTK